MKKKYILALFVLLSGCASTDPVYTFNKISFKGKPVLISSDFNRKTTKHIVNAKFNGIDNRMGSAHIFSVNGVDGTNNYGKYKNKYNSSWDSSYKIFVKPGKVEMKVGPNHYRVIGSPKLSFSFNALPEHNYHILKVYKENPDLTLNWAPVVVDSTEQRVIYPGSISWLSK